MGEFPFMASLVHKPLLGARYHFCGGSIYNEVKMFWPVSNTFIFSPREQWWRQPIAAGLTTLQKWRWDAESHFHFLQYYKSDSGTLAIPSNNVSDHHSSDSDDRSNHDLIKVRVGSLHRQPGTDDAEQVSSFFIADVFLDFFHFRSNCRRWLRPTSTCTSTTTTGLSRTTSALCSWRRRSGPTKVKLAWFSHFWKIFFDEVASAKFPNFR